MRDMTALRGLSLGTCGLLLHAACAADALGKGSWALLSPKGGAGLLTAPQNVLRVTVHRPVPQYYQTQLTHDITAAVPAGKSVRYRFWARSATKNPIHVVIEKRTGPYTHLLDKTVALTPAWKQYDFSVTVLKAYGTDGLAARLQLGQQAGVVEFKDISVGTAP